MTPLAINLLRAVCDWSFCYVLGSICQREVCSFNAVQILSQNDVSFFVLHLSTVFLSGGHINTLYFFFPCKFEVFGFSHLVHESTWGLIMHLVCDIDPILFYFLHINIG